MRYTPVMDELPVRNVFNLFGEDVFGYFIRRRRQALGVSQRRVGEVLGFSQVTVSLYESGKLPGVHMSYEKLKALADVLKMDFYVLCAYSGHIPPPLDDLLINDLHFSETFNDWILNYTKP